MPGAGVGMQQGSADSMGGRAALTGRVYPSLPTAHHIGLYAYTANVTTTTATTATEHFTAPSTASEGMGGVESVCAEAWEMGAAFD